MILSRRDQFARTAFRVLLNKGIESAAVEAAEYANALIDELDRTAPKPERPSDPYFADVADKRTEIEDDGREIRDENDTLVEVSKSSSYTGRAWLNCDSPRLTISDARLFAHRILKLCDEIEGKK